MNSLPETTYIPLRVPVLEPGDDNRREGYLAGRAAGYAAGLRQAEAEIAGRLAALEAEHQTLRRAEQARVDAALDALAHAGAQAATLAAPVVQEAQRAITDAALLLAQAVVGIELSDEPTRAKAALTRALAATETDKVLAVHLSPADLQVLDETQLEQAGVVVRADRALAAGDARTELVDGYLDARVQVALERASKALEGLR